METIQSEIVIEVEGNAVVFGVTARCGRGLPPGVTPHLLDAAAQQMRRLLPVLIAEEEARLRGTHPELLPPTTAPAVRVNEHAPAAVPYPPTLVNSGGVRS